jgi:hypothetical protein
MHRSRIKSCIHLAAKPEVIGYCVPGHVRMHWPIVASKSKMSQTNASELYMRIELNKDESLAPIILDHSHDVGWLT